MENNFDINNKEDFENIVYKTISGKMSFTNNRESYEPLYRGQTKDSYLLRPSLARFVDSTEELYTLEHKIFSEFKKLVNENSNLKKMFQFSEFENKFEFESDWRWLEQMQHFGLPTRLLDWSIKPEIALFFAVNNVSTPPTAYCRVASLFLVLFKNKIKDEPTRKNVCFGGGVSSKRTISKIVL